MQTVTTVMAGQTDIIALFNRLTGVRQSTGNWPGVTVDRKEGRFDLLGRDTAVVDLPGIYSLDASSIDEQSGRPSGMRPRWPVRARPPKPPRSLRSPSAPGVWKKRR